MASPVVDFIHRHSKFIITAHETPDGDAIGSEYAFYCALRKLGKTVRILNADPMPRKFRFVDKGGAVEVLTSGNQLPGDINDYVLVMLDVNDTNNIGQVSTLVIPKIRETAVIDHHEYAESPVQCEHIIETASSTCEILYDLLAELDVEVDFEIAEALYVGIVFDTGSFIYPKTTSKTFGIAKTLVEVGVSPNDVYSRLYESNSVSSLKLQSRVLSSLELFHEQQVAVQTMLRDSVIECGASYEEADLLINIPMKSERIRVSVFFKENLEGIIRCSLRSKGTIDVAEIAQKYGGGGHKTAAGFKLRRSVDDTKEEILGLLERYFIDSGAGAHAE